MTKCDISSAPLTDHCVIKISPEPHGKSFKTRGYWKFNADFLNQKEFCMQVKKLIVEIKSKQLSNSNKWEFLK